MYKQREPEDRIDRYAGPYERWVFSEELGRPFAFPAIAGEPSGYYTALLDGASEPESDDETEVRLPPLWTPRSVPRTITPFAFHERGMQDPRGAVQPDLTVARLLNSARQTKEQAAEAFTPRFKVNFPIAPEAWAATYTANSAPSAWAPRPLNARPSAIVAVIDDGLPFAHHAYLDAQQNTRISSIWLQSAAARPHECVPFGRELVNADIDALRAKHGTNEAAIYADAEAGAVDANLNELGTHLRRHATHGSAVFGMAAGNDSRFGDYPLPDGVQIIAVQLPNTIAWDTSGFGKEMYMLSALHYIFERASRIAQHFGVGELPLIVNFSYGWSAGRHDGQSEMEIAIEELLADRQTVQPATALVMPSGNNFASKMHAGFADVDFTDDRIDIGWQLQPDDLTSSYLELWFPQGFDPAGYKLEVIPPHGISLKHPGEIDIAPDTGADYQGGDPRRFVELEIGAENVGQLSADQNRGNRWRIIVALIPTAYTRGQSRKAPAGLWQVTLKRGADAARLADNDNILIWLQRDDDPSDLKMLGRQSRLVPLEKMGSAWLPARDTQAGTLNPTRQYEPTLGRVSGYGTLNGVASSDRTTRVGGFVKQSLRPCRYSGAGGLQITSDDGATIWGQQVDVTAPADLSHERYGIPSLGVLSGARTRLPGTSIAAPTVARLMVLNAARGQDLMTGFDPSLPLHSGEIDPNHNSAECALIDAQHAARVGPRTAPAVAKG